ncbi:TetR/AcrR family transcriptional regulator [Patulibacter sp. S7RM1-6]
MAGRPRSFDRDAALDQALDAFWSRGYDGVSVAQLTEAMGIAAPSLYAAFGDKRRLFDEAAGRYVERMVAAMDEAFALPTARAAVERLLRESAAFYTEGDHPRGCLVMWEPRLSDDREASFAAIGRRIARGVADGDLPPDADVAALTDLVRLLIAGLAAQARDGVSRERLDAAVTVALAAWPDGD